MPRGSGLIISHATADGGDDDAIKTARDAYDRASSPLTMRTRDEVSRFFDGLDLIEPGVADVNVWLNKKGETKSRTACYGGVGIKSSKLHSQASTTRLTDFLPHSQCIYCDELPGECTDDCHPGKTCLTITGLGFIAGIPPSPE